MGMDSRYIVVSSLSEYIAAIESYNLFNYISRGENQEFEHPLRSGIHRNNFRNYSKFLEQYHLDVETSINQNQDKNFLAFAQHHGIPTNLLDFSFSPLVSLYFSVDSCNDKGYVYFMNKTRMVNINKLIYERPLGWGMLEELLDFDLELYKNILPQMSEVFITNREAMITYFENHAENFITQFKKHRAKSYLDSLKGGVDDFEKALAQYKEDKLKYKADDDVRHEVTLQIYSSYSYFINSMHKIFEGDILYPKSFFTNYGEVSNLCLTEADYAANIHVMIILLKMEELEYCYNDMNTFEYELEFPFYFTFHPPIIDDRVRNQSSVFIFQPFSANKVHINNTPAQVWQKITPDFTIEVQRPEKIKKELDAIGFNLKHIYCDYDSVAKYIVKSF